MLQKEERISPSSWYCALFCLPIGLDIQRSCSGILADAIREDEPLGSWETQGQ